MPEQGLGVNCFQHDHPLELSAQKSTWTCCGCLRESCNEKGMLKYKCASGCDFALCERCLPQTSDKAAAARDAHHRIWGTPEPSSASSPGHESGESEERKQERRRIIEGVDLRSYSSTSEATPASKSSSQSEKNRDGQRTDRSMRNDKAEAVANNEHRSDHVDLECGESSSEISGQTEHDELTAQRELLASGSQEQLFEAGIPQEHWPALHAEGRCKPCRFITTKVGCTFGSSCLYCHAQHQRPSRPWKSKRQQARLFAQRQLTDGAMKGPEEMHRIAQSLSKKGRYMRSVVHGKMRDQEALTTQAASSSSSIRLEQDFPQSSMAHGSQHEMLQ